MFNNWNFRRSSSWSDSYFSLVNAASGIFFIDPTSENVVVNVANISLTV